MALEPISENSLKAKSNTAKTAQERSIFRADARQHYLANQEKVDFPRLLSARFFTVLWILALSLFILGSLITFWPLIEPLIWG